MVTSPKRLEVFLTALDPTIGGEIQKTRPCVIVSPDEMNRHLKTVLVAPLTSSGKEYPFRVAVQFEGKKGHAALDQIRAVDRTRMLRRLGCLSGDEGLAVLNALVIMFEP